MGLFSGSKSSTSTSTTNNNYDQRSVNDAGGGIVGSRNTLDASQTWVQTTDASQSSSWSDRSVSNWTDSSSSSSSVNITDGGAVAAMSEMGAAQAGAAQAIAAQAIGAARESASGAVGAALKSQQNAIGANAGVLQSALGFSSTTANQAFASSAAAMGWAGEAFDKLTGLTSKVLDAGQAAGNTAAQGVAGAYSSAATQANGNKTLTIAALAAVAIVAAFVVAKKG